MEPKHARKKRLALQKCYMFTQREWRSIAQIYLIQMTSEKPFYFAFKTRIENRNGDVNAW